MISDYDREHLGDIIAGHGDWFTAQLLRLMHKADSENFMKLAVSFPKEALAYTKWYETRNLAVVPSDE